MAEAKKRRPMVKVHDVPCPRCLAAKYHPCVTLKDLTPTSNGKVHRARYRAAQLKMGLEPKGKTPEEWGLKSGTTER